MPRRGLPLTMGMRHDEHYVETLTSAVGKPIGRIIPIDQLDPNPNQPRQVMGDLSDLMASISEKGIIEPLVVRERAGRYQIAAGERRYQAAVQLGIPEVPVVIKDFDDAEIIEIGLIENLQRKDLTPLEEAEALNALAERFGHTHEDLAQHLGRSRTSITESLSLNSIPKGVKDLCRLADISSKSLLLQVVRHDDPKKMIAFIEKITRDGRPTREKGRREIRKTGAGRSPSFVYNYLPPTKAFTLKLKFRKSKVERSEIVEALEAILEQLRSKRS